MSKRPRKQFTGSELMFEKHLHMTVRIAIINIGALALMGGGGYLLDQQLGTKPIFLIIGILLAFVLAQAAIIVTISRITKDQ